MKAPNCACSSVWRKESPRLGRAPSGTDLLTCCHLLLRYHHLVTLSNKTSNCGPFEAKLCNLASLFTLKGPQWTGGWPHHPVIHLSILPSLRLTETPFLPLAFFFFWLFVCSQSSTFEKRLFSPHHFAVWPKEAFLPQRCLKKAWLSLLECKL